MPDLAARTAARRVPLLGVAAGLAAAVAAVALRALAPDGAWVHEPLHSTMEAAGAVVALALAVLLELRRRVTGLAAPRDAWLAAAFATMGVLDAAHACTHVGPAFFWSRALPTLLGGLLVAGMWSTRRAGGAPRLTREEDDRRAGRLIGGAVAVALLLSAGLLLAPGAWPAAFDAQGVYTTWARALNVAGGIGFLAGAAFLAREARVVTVSRLAPGTGEAAVFATQLVLFGVAGLMFWLSDIWRPVWWLFHVLRFAAYGVALVSGAEVFRRIEETQRGHLERELALQTRDLERMREELARTLATAGRPEGT